MSLSLFRSLPLFHQRGTQFEHALNEEEIRCMALAFDDKLKMQQLDNNFLALIMSFILIKHDKALWLKRTLEDLEYRINRAFPSLKKMGNYWLFVMTKAYK